MGNWNKFSITVTVVGMLIVVAFSAYLGLLWGMFYEIAIISTIILAQNAIAILISWFASKFPYSNIRWILLVYWSLATTVIAMLFLLAVIVETMWWWVSISLIFIGTELVLTLLGSYLASERHPR